MNSLADIAGHVGFSVWLLAAAGIITGFLLPGWLLVRLFPSAFPALSAFLGSALILFHLVLGLQLAGMAITFPNLASALLAVSTLLLVLGGRRMPVSDAPGKPGTLRIAGIRNEWLPAVLISLAALLVRCVVDPLSGWDTFFRWDRIARLMIETGTLSWYPATTPADFSLYAWAEGIPPLVPVLHVWIYLSSGSSSPALTAPLAGLVAVLLFWLVQRFAAGLWGNSKAGWAAAALLGTSSLAGWSLAMGQETGLTALTLLSLLYFLFLHQRSGERHHLVWAGLSAAAGALSRDYCVIYIAVGAAVLASSPQGRRSLGFFLAVAGTTAMPWYIRNAWVTGNPFYSHDIAGLFPVNAGQQTWMHAASTFAGFSAQPGAWSRSAALLATLAGPVLAVGAIGLARHQHTFRGAMVGAALIVFALWLWSVHQTLGGIAYSTRVLTPLLAIAAVSAGWLGTLRSTRVGLLAAGLAAVLTVDAARRAWFLPADPFTSPVSLTWDGWREMRAFRKLSRSPAMWERLVEAAQGRAILVDHPDHHALVRSAGGVAAPFFSPLARAAFAQEPTSATIAALQRDGVRFVVLTRGSPFTPRIPFLQALSRHIRPLAMGPMDVYDLALGPFLPDAP